jgi:hydrogenase maturation protein HypF
VVRDIEAGTDRSAIALGFHQALARVIAAVCRRIRERTRVEVVALSGGCFQNRILTSLTHAELTGLGFEVLLHRRVPPGDGGISLGQAAVASWLKK